MASHRSSSNSQSPQVSRILLSILADLNNAVVWMVSTHPLFSSGTSCPWTNCTKSTNYNWYHSYFHVTQFFQFSSKVEVLIFLFAFFLFYPVVSWDSKVHKSVSSFFFLLTRSGCLAEIRWSICISKSQRCLCIFFSGTDAGLCIYHLFLWSNLNFLHNSRWITLPIQSCVVLYSSCANLLHSFIMQLIISTLSPHNLYLLFCCIFSILAWI